MHNQVMELEEFPLPYKNTPINREVTFIVAPLLKSRQYTF